jgi:parvulin-like peptidyl-prolyl isomerase
MLPHMKIPFAARLLIYCAVLAYIAIDLYACSGPLRRAVNRRKIDSPESIAAAKESGLVALVLGRPITVPQLTRAARERLWLEGKSWDKASTEQKKWARMAALNDLIDHQLIRSKIAANQKAERATKEEIDARFASLRARFASAEEWQQSMTNQGIASEEECRLRLAASIEMEKYLERQLTPLIAVSQEEVVDFYQKHQAQLAQPEMIRARHVFWATLDQEINAVKAQAEAALTTLQKKEKTFEQLVAEFSEDPRSKTSAGDLGWFSRTRLPADFVEPCFAMKVGEPQLFLSKLGWHLLEVTEKRPAQPRTLEECREEIAQALADQKRPAAIQNIRNAIRKTHQQHIHIYQSVLNE